MLYYFINRIFFFFDNIINRILLHLKNSNLILTHPLSIELNRNMNYRLSELGCDQIRIFLSNKKTKTPPFDSLVAAHSINKEYLETNINLLPNALIRSLNVLARPK